MTRRLGTSIMLASLLAACAGPRAAGDELAYHASESGDFRPCANPIDPVQGGAADR